MVPTIKHLLNSFLCEWDFEGRRGGSYSLGFRT
jgi:hypothetical protein